MRNAGLDPETPPKTWSEWRRMSEQITRSGNGRYWGGGIPSFPHMGGSLRATPFFRQLGTDFGSDERVNLSDPKFQQALQFIRDMNANFPPGLANGMNEEPLWNAFQLADQQIIGFVVDGTWNQAVSQDAGLDVGIAPLPLPDQGGQVGNCLVGTIYIGVPRGVPQEDANLFWKMYSEICLSEEHLQYVIEFNMCPPVQSMLLRQSRMTDPAMYSGIIGAQEILSGLIPPLADFTRNNGQVWEILDQQVLARATMTNVPISQICSEAQARITPLLR